MSPSYKLTRQDVKSWLVNCVIFFAPVVMYIATQVASLQPIDWRLVYITGAGLLLNLLKKCLVNYAPIPTTES